MVESFLVINQFFNFALNIMHMLFVLHIHNEIYIRLSYVNGKNICIIINITGCCGGPSRAMKTSVNPTV